MVVSEYNKLVLKLLNRVKYIVIDLYKINIEDEFSIALEDESLVLTLDLIKYYKEEKVIGFNRNLLKTFDVDKIVLEIINGLSYIIYDNIDKNIYKDSRELIFNKIIIRL